MLSSFLWVVRRDLRLALRRPMDGVATVFFFVIVATLFPLGVGSEPTLLRSLAPGVLWVGALLASITALGRLFATDHADGTLEQMLLSSEPLVLLVLGKVAAHWLLAGLPLLLLTPPLALAFGLKAPDILTLLLTLLLGTPVLSLLGAIGSALTLGARGAQVLMALLVLPLYVPVLIFGSGAVGSEAVQAHLALLGGLLAASLALAPWATAAALRIALE